MTRITYAQPDDTVRREGWPESSTLKVSEVHSLGIRGQLLIDGKPSGPPDAFYSYRPDGVFRSFRILDA